MSELEPDNEGEVIEAIRDAWKKHPNMRLTQLIFNAVPTTERCPEVFYVDDSELIKLLKNMNTNN